VTGQPTEALIADFLSARRGRPSVQWDDEMIPRDSALALFDAIIVPKSWVLRPP
jgi:hypothetical protein